MTGRLDREPRRRIRNPELHRQAILDAAAEAFTARGFHHATVRDIARRAGVTHGLVLRHFGTKERLFLAAVPGTRDLGQVAAGPRETLPERITAAYVDRMERDSATDPFVALLRTAVVDDRASDNLLLAMQESTTEVYRELLGEEALKSVVPFLAALLIGVTFSRYILHSGELADLPSDAFRKHLENAVRALLLR
jgi:AcrR family transcriptional regulator